MIDVGTSLVVAIMRNVLLDYRDFGGNIESYINNHAEFVAAVGRVLEQLGLSMEDEHSPLGWMPTQRLICHIASRATRASAPSNKSSTDTDIAIKHLLSHAAGVNRDRFVRHSEALRYLDVLTALGLLRDGAEESVRATSLLRKLLVLRDNEEFMGLTPNQNKNPGDTIRKFLQEPTLR